MSCDFGNVQMFSEPKFILWKSVVKNIKKYGIFFMFCVGLMCDVFIPPPSS